MEPEKIYPIGKSVITLYKNNDERFCIFLCFKGNTKEGFPMKIFKRKDNIHHVDYFLNKMKTSGAKHSLNGDDKVEWEYVKGIKYNLQYRKY